ncbi:unnamed protein product, partial [Chrysoparadoxa australica]
MEGGVSYTDVLWQQLRVSVNLEERTVRGSTSIWLRFRRPKMESLKYVNLHCRQCSVTRASVNGKEAHFDHLDPLKKVVFQNYRDAEVFDLHYRGMLWTTGAEDSGELHIAIPKSERVLPPDKIDKMADVPPGSKEASDQAPGAPDAGSGTGNGNGTVNGTGAGAGARTGSDAVAGSKDAVAGSKDSNGTDGGISTGIAGPQKKDKHKEKPSTPQLIPARGRLATIPAPPEALPAMDWELTDPKSGIVFQQSGSSGGVPTAPHFYTTYSHGGMDYDGPRCWFPCLDNLSKGSVVELELQLDDPSLVPLFNGLLLSKTGNTYRFCTEYEVQTRQVGLAVGPFFPWSHSQASSLTVHCLGRDLVEQAAHSCRHMKQAISFFESYLDASYPFSNFRIAAVEGLRDLYYPFGGLLMVRATLLSPSDVPEEDLPGNLRVSLVEGMLHGWIQQAVRLRAGMDRWIHHGVVGYLCNKYVGATRGEEQAQYEKGRLMEVVIDMDRKLGSPSIQPPDADAYILEALDPEFILFMRLKGTLLLHLMEARVSNDSVDSLQLALKQLVVGVGDPVESLSTLDWLRSVKSIASAYGKDVGRDLLDQFVTHWVRGQGVAYLRCGVNFNKRNRQVEVVLEQFNPPLTTAIPLISALSWPIHIVKVPNKLAQSTQSFILNLQPGYEIGLHISLLPLSLGYKKECIAALAAFNRPSHLHRCWRWTAATFTKKPLRPLSATRGTSQCTASPGPEPVAPAAPMELEALAEAGDINTTPVLWVKVDPRREWIREVRMRKADFQWVEQLFRDGQTDSQIDALKGLSEVPIPSACKALGECLRGKVAHTQEEHAPSVRVAAAEALAIWQNNHAPPTAQGAWKGLAQLLRCFRERSVNLISPTLPFDLIPLICLPLVPAPLLPFRFNEDSEDVGRPGLLLPNLFTDESTYRIEKATIWAIANVKAANGGTPAEVCNFLVEVLSENDNSGNPYDDCYLIAQVLVGLGQLASAKEGGLPPTAIEAAVFQARRWLDWEAVRPSRNGVVGACALQSLCELELIKGGVPTVPYADYTSAGNPLAVRVAGAQSVIRQFLAEDTERSAVDGLGAALKWVTGFVRNEQDQQMRESAIMVLIDALERRPPRAAFLARFQGSDPLLGQCDPWASPMFFRPLGPGGSSYRPLEPLPTSFDGDAEVVDAFWELLTEGSSWNQGLRVQLLRVYRNIWGFSTPPCARNQVKARPEHWRGALETIAVKVQAWLMHGSKPKDWLHRDWEQWQENVRSGVAHPQVPSCGSYGPQGDG